MATPDFSLLDKPASCRSNPAGRTACACRAAAEAGCARHAARGPAAAIAAGGTAAIATGGACLQAARAGCLDQVSGAAWPAARPLAIVAASSCTGPNKGDDNFDAPATDAADIASTLIAAFRRHLKSCSKLPASLSGADDVKVKLRVLMTPDGRLAAEPILIEASASMKGPLLMQGAIRALQACQPYAMLPADRYGEWKVLDLSFTPQDFTSG